MQLYPSFSSGDLSCLRRAIAALQAYLSMRAAALVLFGDEQGV